MLWPEAVTKVIRTIERIGFWPMPRKEISSATKPLVYCGWSAL